MSPPHFAIVTKFCNGCTLYRHVHVSETHFDMGHVVDMVSQLSQGMLNPSIIVMLLAPFSITLEKDTSVIYQVDYRINIDSFLDPSSSIPSPVNANKVKRNKYNSPLVERN